MAFVFGKRYYVMKVGEKLKLEREKRKCSVEAAAQAIGIASTFLIEVENGLSELEPSLLLSICRFYDVKVVDLLADL